jgi:hypothetical protein
MWGKKMDLEWVSDSDSYLFVIHIFVRKPLLAGGIEDGILRWSLGSF